ncbi:MAG: hypothetical protein ACREHV_15220 [Rhizomicrobium sp.]
MPVVLDAIAHLALPREHIAAVLATASPPAASPLSLRGAAATIGRFAIVFTLFAIATALIFWPVTIHLHSVLIGPPEDNMQDFWNSWYAAVGWDQAHFFATGLLRFPEGTPLIYQSFAYPQVFVVVGLSRIFGTDLHTLVALQNITLLASFPLAGVDAFYLVRHLVGSTAGALIGGLVFAFNPSHVAHALHHAGVSSIEFLPFFVLAWLLALERRSIMWLAVAAIFFMLSALSCWYYLFFCAYFIGFQLLYQRVRDKAWPRGWYLAAPALCILFVTVTLMPLLLPMLSGARASIYEGGGNALVADLLGYVAFPPQHLLGVLTRPLYDRFTGYPWEATVYLGLVNLGLLGWACLRHGLARRSLMFYVVFGMATFVILASGEALHIDGAVTFLHLPDVVLDRLPFFANVRAPSRAIVFVYLFLSIGVGIAIASAWRQPGIGRRSAAIVAMALIVLDFYPAHLATTPATCPKGVALVTADPERGFGVLNLPFGYVNGDTYMFEQACHGRPIMGGTTSREMTTTLINRLPFDNLTWQREQLAQAHVKYILLHHPRNGLYQWSGKLPRVAQFLKTYRAVYSGPDMTVLRVY